MLIVSYLAKGLRFALTPDLICVVRPVSRRKTQKGLGEEDFKDDAPPASKRSPEEADEAPPPSSRGVRAVEVSEVGRYSMRPGRSVTQEFASPDLSALEKSGKRRETSKMPALSGDSAPHRSQNKKSASIRPRRSELSAVAGASLDSREAYVLSLLDGNLSMQSLLDVTAMSKTELQAIIDRLVGLGLVKLTR